MDLTAEQWTALAIFGLTYLVIATESRERTIAAMAGAAAMFAFGVVTDEELISFVNFEALSLLFGMMVLVGVLREAAFFRWLGIHLANFCHCDPKRMLIVFVLMTAFLSALLPNVTTVLFMVIVTIEIVGYLKINPVPFIISEIIASNIGGTATMIGDPPNIMIATATGLTFRDFLFNTGPIAAVATLAALGVLYYYYRKQLSIPLQIDSIPQKTNEVIVDKRLFRIGLGTFAVIVALFFFQDTTGLAPSIVTALGAIFLLFVGGPRMREILEDVEWSTLIYYACLLIIVGGLNKTDLLAMVSDRVGAVIGNNELVAVTATLWVAAFASSFIDNTPFVAAFIPLLQPVTRDVFVNSSALWWTLALGAGFGGNGTMIGSSPNIVATGVARKMGHKISFVEFTKIGMLVLLVSVGIANLMLYLMLFLRA